MSRPVFMSVDHVERMNAILRDEPSVRAACRDLDRSYAFCYELNGGPEGRQVYWSMVFDPSQGVRMGLDKPERADLTFVATFPKVPASFATGSAGAADAITHGRQSS